MNHHILLWPHLFSAEPLTETRFAFALAILFAAAAALTVLLAATRGRLMTPIALSLALLLGLEGWRAVRTAEYAQESLRLRFYLSLNANKFYALQSDQWYSTPLFSYMQNLPAQIGGIKGLTPAEVEKIRQEKLGSARLSLRLQQHLLWQHDGEAAER